MNSYKGFDIEEYMDGNGYGTGYLYIVRDGEVYDLDYATCESDVINFIDNELLA